MASRGQTRPAAAFIAHYPLDCYITVMRRGIAVSPGVAVGTAYCVDEVIGQLEPHELNSVEAADELARLDQAWTATDDDLRAMHTKVSTQVGEQEAAIFQTHQAILHDSTFIQKVRNWITKENLSSRAAMHHVMNEYTSLFARIKDDYLKERLADVRDVISRISTHLLNLNAIDEIHPDGPVILVARELLPSQALAFGQIDVRLYKDTPLHRANFIRLAKTGYFGTTFFHRVLDNFVVQGGNSDNISTQKVRAAIGDYLIPSEFSSKHQHNRGAFSAAKYAEQNVSKASSPFEFFIVQGKRGAHHLDNDHTVFGEVTDGMDVADKIVNLPRDGNDCPQQEAKMIKIGISD